MTDMQPSQAQPLAPKNAQGLYEIPAGIVGGNTFGRYPKISVAQTWNMMVSDGFLVDYAGYKNVLPLTNNPVAEGRGTYSSTILPIIIAVISNGVFSIDQNLIPTRVGSLATTVGEVYIAENNGGQIALSDGVHIYIYTPSSSAFEIAPIDFVPGFLSFQNTYFICASIGTSEWRLSANNNGLSWPETSGFIGLLQTKPDTVQAFVPMPGRGNMGFLFGTSVIEQWTFTGAALFPYQRNSSFNIDYGCINPNSIAYQGNFIAWIGINEEAGAVVMYTTGGDIKEVSTDGIDFLLSTLKNPEDCSGFLIKVDGHLFYQVTFKTDNVSFILDLTNEIFFTVTDENMNYHIARKIVYFNTNYYFVSFNDGNLYEFGTQFTNYQYSDTNIQQIPRIRICPPVRLPTQRPLIFKSLGFTIEQGQHNPDNLMKVELSTSRDGGETYGNSVSIDMNPSGLRKSRFLFQRLGRANDMSSQLRFIGDNRFVVGEGIYEAYL
jgi:hypothetical protein